MKMLEIKLGYSCNSNCVFCINQDKKHIKNFSSHVLKELIDKSVVEGCQKITVTGGEPLLYSNFFEVISYAKKKGIKNLEIHSNGRILSKESLVKKLATFEPIRFLISLHFPNARLYKKYSQVDGFDETIHGIRNLVKNNMNFTINTIIMKPTIPHYKNLEKLVNKLQITNWQFIFISAQNIMDKMDKYVPCFSESVPIIQNIIKNNPHISIEMKNVPVCVVGKEYRGNLSPVYGPERLHLVAGKSLFPANKIRESQSMYPNCKDCMYRLNCVGVRIEYFQLYGSHELQAIKSYGKS